jgi:NADPH:quinone reductase
MRFRPEALTDSLATLIDWYARAGFARTVGHVLPLDRAAEGLELLRTRAATGKVVIAI